MKILSRTHLRLLALGATLVAVPALAHPGGVHVHGFVDGITHPLTGLDHLLAALTVGLVAGLSAGRTRLAVPVLFGALFAVGIALGAFLGVPAFELALAASLMVVGGLVAVPRLATARVGVVVPVVAAFVGLLHGHAHGAELTQTATTSTYTFGLVLGTLGAVAAGSLAVRLVGVRSARLMGAAVALTGAAVALVS